jgi:Family of unknown function (DUF6188)
MSCDLGWIIGRSIVEVVSYEGPSWSFRFGGAMEVRADSPWRLIRGGHIVLSSEDHGHQYGHKEPIDAVAVCRTMICGKAVRSAEVREGTRDIVMLFETGDRLEIIPLSSGYESWQIAGPDGSMTVAQGGGNLVAWRVMQ